MHVFPPAKHSWLPFLQHRALEYGMHVASLCYTHALTCITSQSQLIAVVESATCSGSVYPADYDLAPKQRPQLYILCKDAERCRRLTKLSGLIGALAFSDEVKVRSSSDSEHAATVRQCSLARHGGLLEFWLSGLNFSTLHIQRLSGQSAQVSPAWELAMCALQRHSMLSY